MLSRCGTSISTDGDSVAKSKRQKLRSLLRRGIDRVSRRVDSKGDLGEVKAKWAEPGIPDLDVTAGRTDQEGATVLPVVVFRDGEGEIIQQVSSSSGQTLLQVSQSAQIEIDHFCGGRSSCGTCRVIVMSGTANLGKMGPNEALVLGPVNVGKDCRLACQAVVRGDVEVQIPRWF